MISSPVSVMEPYLRMQLNPFLGQLLCPKMLSNYLPTWSDIQQGTTVGRTVMEFYTCTSSESAYKSVVKVFHGNMSMKMKLLPSFLLFKTLSRATQGRAGDSNSWKQRIQYLSSADILPLITVAISIPLHCDFHLFRYFLEDAERNYYFSPQFSPQFLIFATRRFWVDHSVEY